MDATFVRPSFEVLYAVARSHLPDALRVLKVPPADVDDLLHDIVIIAYRALDRYEPRSGLASVSASGPASGARRGPDDGEGGEGRESSLTLKPWLGGIAWRLVAKRRERAYRRFELPHGDVGNLSAGAANEAPSSEQVAAEAERRRLLERVLRHIRPERAEVLLMHAFLEMSVPDIARELGLNENTVKSRIARARADALAAMKRLRRDEQSALHGSPAALPLPLCWTDREEGPFTLGPEPDPEPAPPRCEARRWEAPATPMLRLAARATAMAAVLALGVVLGAALATARLQAAPAGSVGEGRPSIFAASEAPAGAPAPWAAALAPGWATTRNDAGPRPTPVPPGAGTAAEPDPGPPDDASLPEARGAATEKEERALLEEVRVALNKHAWERAFAGLGKHEQRFPRGLLCGEREWLRARVLRERQER